MKLTPVGVMRCSQVMRSHQAQIVHSAKKSTINGHFRCFKTAFAAFVPKDCFFKFPWYSAGTSWSITWSRDTDWGHCLFPRWLLFTESFPLAHGARQTARQTRAPLASSFCLFLMNHPTFICDQFKAPWLPSPLPFPELHLRGELCTAASKSCGRESLLRKGRNQRVGETLSGISVRLIFINHLHLSSASPRTSSGRLISTAVVLINEVDGRSVGDAARLARRHVNKLMTLILKIRHISLCATWWYVLTGKVELFRDQTVSFFFFF